jgi:hypothetical protein
MNKRKNAKFSGFSYQIYKIIQFHIKNVEEHI